jgi:hypothetical protein
MPTRSFPLAHGEPPRIDVSWEGRFQNFSVRFDGAPAGTVKNPDQLKLGAIFKLPDGSQLGVKLVTEGNSIGLHLVRNGRPLPGSDGDPVMLAARAGSLLLLAGGVDVVLGLVAVVLSVGVVLRVGFGPVSLGLGVVLALLGWLVRQKRSLAALIVGMVLFTADSIIAMGMGFWAAYVADGQARAMAPMVAMAVRLSLFIAMVQGVHALRALRREAGSGPRLETGRESGA